MNVSLLEDRDLALVLADEIARRLKLRSEQIARLAEKLDAAAAESNRVDLQNAALRAGMVRSDDFGEESRRLATLILVELGIGTCASQEPGADTRRDRVSQLIEPTLAKMRAAALRTEEAGDGVFAAYERLKADNGRLTAQLAAEVEKSAPLYRRIDELLEANVRFEERARAAEAEASNMAEVAANKANALLASQREIAQLTGHEAA